MQSIEANSNFVVVLNAIVRWRQMTKLETLVIFNNVGCDNKK